MSDIDYPSGLSHKIPLEVPDSSSRALSQGGGPAAVLRLQLRTVQTNSSTDARPHQINVPGILAYILQ